MSNEIKKNINSLNPNKETGFTIPQNYFDGVEDEVFIKVSEDNFSKQIDFETPEGYFETIEDNILNKVETPKKGKIISLRRSFYRTTTIAVAASILLFFGIQFYNVTQENTTNNIVATDIEEWFSDSLGFDSNTELALVFENDFDLTENDILFNDDLIEDYFNNTSDIDLLNEIE